MRRADLRGSWRACYVTIRWHRGRERYYLLRQLVSRRHRRGKAVTW